LQQTTEPEPTTRRPERASKRTAKNRLLESFRESPMGKTSEYYLSNNDRLYLLSVHCFSKFFVHRMFQWFKLV